MRLHNVVLWLRRNVTEHIFSHGATLGITVDLSVLWVRVGSRGAYPDPDLKTGCTFAEVQP